MAIEVPQYLYKYRAATTEKDLLRIKQMIEDGVIYFGTSFEFNDIFDCKPVLSIACTDEEFVKRGMNFLASKHGTLLDTERTEAGIRQTIGTLEDPRTPTRKKQLQQQMAEQLDAWGVYCAAARCDNILMWSHYADSFRGVCFEINSDEFSYLGPVKYLKARPIIDAMPGGESSRSAVDKALFTKSIDWQYEEEWRAFSDKGPANMSNAGIKRVIFGPRCPSSIRAKIFDIVKQSKRHIDFAEVRADPLSFALNVVAL